MSGTPNVARINSAMDAQKVPQADRDRIRGEVETWWKGLQAVPNQNAIVGYVATLKSGTTTTSGGGGATGGGAAAGGGASGGASGGTDVASTLLDIQTRHNVEPGPAGFTTEMQLTMISLLGNVASGITIEEVYDVTFNMVVGRKFYPCMMSVIALGAPSDVFAQPMRVFEHEIEEFYLQSRGRTDQKGKEVNSNVKRSAWALMGCIIVDQSSSKMAQAFKEKRGNPLLDDIPETKGKEQFRKIAKDNKAKHNAGYLARKQASPLPMGDFDKFVNEIWEKRGDLKTGA